METGNESRIAVEVAYALPSRQVLIPLTVPAGTTAEAAIRLSGIFEQFGEIDLSVNRVGVFGRACPLDHVLQAGDRIEIYRPLIADPKEARRKRAAESRTRGRDANR